MLDYEIFELGEVRLQMGETLRDAKLAYRTYGSLNEAKSLISLRGGPFRAENGAGCPLTSLLSGR
jgi:hypothetical protein